VTNCDRTGRAGVDKPSRLTLSRAPPAWNAVIDSNSGVSALIRSYNGSEYSPHRS